ncbi:DUF4174 domain-containing protein [Sulfitobacter sp. F26169L]|uniref:DUF4174 domain-containing protein n=1 Tax=Sulfitobacter sp. F26169L TaxID=2996015 RepID=UPI0022608F21|nr:DUF4174 domain-containing protein [Sulfitobacter sp. F26169L]MCX7564821.1 DUF4174 domain-containing protein [Sulfitobacter sp. F26169L]
MKPLLGAVIIAVFASTAQAQTLFSPDLPLVVYDARTTDLAEFKWKKRPVIVFADSTEDPAFVSQMEFLVRRADDLTERDVVVIVDTDPDARSAIRLQMRPRGFMLTLVGKDGNVTQRKPFPWSVREITRSIDKMPIRKREIREAKEAAEG